MDMNDYKLIPAESRESRMVVLERDEDGTPTVWCDPEIADLVSALNKAGIRTVASCSGHGHRPGNIMLADGRELVIARDFDEARKIDAMFPGINGEPAIRKLGIMGAAFDPPSVRRAYTYSDQPNNTTAWKLGRAACKERSGGDFIDYGLQMLRYLQDEGFGVFEIDEAAPQPAEQNPAPDVPVLVEALTMARETIASALRANAPDYFTTDADIARHVVIQRIDTALAARRKQGGEE